MTKKPIKIIFTIFISIALLSILTIFYSKSFESENSITTHPQNDVYLKINGKIHSTQFVTSDTVESFMQRLMNEKKINFSTKTYIGMGKFVEEINGTKPDGENYWIYYVNSKKANIGISNYKLNPGDIVSWKYEKNTY